MTRRSMSLSVAVAALAAALPTTASAAGGLDPTFGDGGFVNLSDAAAVRHVETYETGPFEGKAAIEGSVDGGDFVARVNADGSLDTSFSDDGIALLPPGTNPSSIAPYDDGSVAYATYSPSGVAVRRLTTDGREDLRFGESVVLQPSSNPDASNAIPAIEVVPGTNKLVVAATTSIYSGLGYYLATRAELHMLDLDGDPVMSWNGGSPVPVRFAGSVPHLSDIAVGEDGSIWAVGAAHPFARFNQLGVQRFTAGGNPDPNFTPGTDDGTVLEMPGSAYQVELGQGESGDPVVMGSTGLGRIASDGRFADGFEMTPFPTSRLGYPSDFAVDGAGRISVLFNPNGRLGVAQFDSDGGFNEAFGNAGIVTIQWPGTDSTSAAIGATDMTQILGVSLYTAPFGTHHSAAGLVQLSNGVDPYFDAPETAISDGPADGQVTSDPQPVFSFDTDQQQASFECSTANANGPGGFGLCANPFTMFEQANGRVDFAVRAVSVYGVADATPATRSFLVDADPLDTTIDFGPANGATVNSSSVRFEFSSSPRKADYFLCTVDREQTYSCEGSWLADGLDQGKHVFRVAAVDKGGRVDPTPAVRRFSVDAPGPACDFPELRTPPALRGVAEEGMQASILCPEENAKILVVIRVSRGTAQAFDLRSRSIASGRGELEAGKRDEIQVRLNPGVAEKLSRFRGSTVFFKATATPTGATKAVGHRSARYGQFDVG